MAHVVLPVAAQKEEVSSWRPRLPVVVGLALVLVAALVFAGYRAGRDHTPVVTHQAMAYSSGVQATASVGGWVYDVPLDIGWWSADGEWNEGSTPACLVPAHGAGGVTAPIKFGAVAVTHSSMTVRQVVWIECLN